MTELYIGLMSGTSIDGIDAALVEFTHDGFQVLATHSHAYRGDVRARLVASATNPAGVNLPTAATLHVEVGRAFAEAANALLQQAGRNAGELQAIGSHGQTIWHDPDNAVSVQLGDPGTLAAIVGAPVVADFRTSDMALGGQGAPLAPAFHAFAFGDANQRRAVVNIGGIANVTALRPGEAPTGFDTGPGNTLLDQWCRRHQDAAFDIDGDWAAAGQVDATLLQQLIADPYFELAPPKSTGTDYFNLDWLDAQLGERQFAPQDIQATLSELTATTVAVALGDADAVRICGGGAANKDLMRRLTRQLPNQGIGPTSDWGVDPDWVEAIAFAWLARQRLHAAPSNIPSVTGASRPVSLGGIYLPPR